ncbi:MAG: glycolate oxidase subunit GlcE [Gammaproteobacteria bacterium]|nr:glycolate oxidase subunit GlcE [Gammaproteobacteria bacterium]
MAEDVSNDLAAQVQQAFVEKQALYIAGSGSKLLLGRAVSAQSLAVKEHCGIVEYVPGELVITARAGTSLQELESVLAESGQMLPFEPPHLGEGATLGGTIACGLSGPRRPYAGAARDFTLGVKMINGQGEVLSFGGQVMKNVAGYDASRLMVGAQGTLGVLLAISLKVLPQPACEHTLAMEMDAATAIAMMTQLANIALPLTGACHLPATSEQAAQLWLRLSGAEEAVTAAVAFVKKQFQQRTQRAQLTYSEREKKKGDGQAGAFWRDLRERRLPFFIDTDAVWRLSLPAATPMFAEILPGACLLDWGGAQRWLKTGVSADVVQTAAQKMGGHATLFDRHGATLAPLSPALMKMHQQVKTAFDPGGILNPGRLYEGL